jgi:RNA polymerase sigma-70 factor (ECF subfamily)
MSDIYDEALMLRYCEGDLSAFQELYGRHSRGLYRFLSWRSPRRDWVDEIAQDSWFSLHQTRASYTPRATFRTFLYQIARNRLIDLLRQPQAVAEDELPPTAADASAAPDRAMESRQQNSALHAAIQALPAEQKEALILQQFSGMSLEEIAQLVAAPVETVKSRLRYAMKKLREQYAQEEQA